MQGENEDAAESVAEAGNEFSNLSIGLVAFVCVIMGKLEIYCYYGEGRERQRERKEGRKPDTARQWVKEVKARRC